MKGKVFVSDFIGEAGKGVRLPEKVRIFDTTLRDGDQTPGVSFTTEQKLLIARQLDKVGVDTIEAGTPVSSEGERKAVTAIAKAGLKAEICGLARPVKEDIDAALACGVGCVHIFISTSDLHLKYILKKTREQVLKQATEGIAYAKDRGAVVEFSAMDELPDRLGMTIQKTRNLDRVQDLHDHTKKKARGAECPSGLFCVVVYLSQ